MQWKRCNRISTYKLELTFCRWLLKSTVFLNTNAFVCGFYFERVNTTNKAILTLIERDSYQFQHQDLFSDRQRIVSANVIGRHLDKSVRTRRCNVHTIIDQISRPSRIYLPYLNRRGRIVSGFRQARPYC